MRASDNAVYLGNNQNGGASVRTLAAGASLLGPLCSLYCAFCEKCVGEQGEVLCSWEIFLLPRNNDLV